MKLKAQYIGPTFFAGIPARDLSDRDWSRLSPEQRELVASSDIYKIVPEQESEKKPATNGGKK